ncbi:MAG: Sulfatase [Parcubacteria group bacterium GW2011_GWA2_42_11]|nr:MAG: Sulfatase [Parcubacteria group bacterium GW2011_GWA2_42_11]
MTNGIKNLIIISIDNLRTDCIGANPDKRLLKKYRLKTKLRTPILDNIARKGVFFNNCVTAAPYTTAAHASILTGKWPREHKLIEFFRNKLTGDTILDILKKEKFLTLFQTDYPFLLGPALGFGKNADKFIASQESMSFNWIKKNRQKRLVCFFHFSDIHSPYGFNNLPEDSRQYEKEIKILLKKYRIEADNKIKAEGGYIFRSMEKKEIILNQNYQKIIDEMYNLKNYSAIMDLYINGINRFEKKRFKLFWQSIKKYGLDKDSLIIIVGDHGEAWSDANQGHFSGGSQDALNDEIIKVPLIFYRSGAARRGLINKIVRTIDIVPTALYALGINALNKRLDGIDILNNTPDGLPAFSQAWSNHTDRLASFIKKSAEKQIINPPETHGHLLASSLNLDSYKLAYDYSGGEKTSERFYVNGKIKKNGPTENRRLLVKMRNVLNEYDRQTIKNNMANAKSNNNKILKMQKAEIAEKLRLLGYKI